MDQTERRPTRALPAINFVVTVMDGPEAGRFVGVDPTRPSRVLVGKSPVCDIVLSDPMVSRRHAAFEVSEDYRLVLTDLESMNGTYANGVSVSTAFLEGGEIVRVGGVTLRVDLVAATTDATTAVPSRKTFGRLIGESPRMLVLYTLCERLAASDVPVVIEGETGTGKELVAECLHEASARANSPFVVFDASAVPRGSLEVTLFGERGASDGDARRGLFELAQNGTLFIDALDELELEMQAKVLRAIERGEILRLGDTSWRRVNVRVIAATSKNLDKLVEARRFREDLFFRIAVTRLELPPLRRREGDVPLLVHHFFKNQFKGADRSDEFLSRHAGYEWPGNVRELQNAVLRFAALGEAASLQPTRKSAVPFHDKSPSGPTSVDAEEAAPSDFLRQVVEEDLSYADARARVLDVFERLYVERVLAQNGGNVSRAAAASGLARRYFQTLRSRHK